MSLGTSLGGRSTLRSVVANEILTPVIPAWNVCEVPMRRRLLTRENVIALILCLIVIAVIVMTADQAPLWIYQGF
jgi:hypothetical protein